MFGRKKKGSNLPDIREPIIQVLRLIEEKPYQFDDLVGNFHFYEGDTIINRKNPPKRGKKIFSIDTSSDCMLNDGFHVIRIKLENGTSISKFTQDELKFMDYSLRELESILENADQEERVRKEEQSRKDIHFKIKNL